MHMLPEGESYAAPPTASSEPGSWPLASRIAFRFTAVYFSLYVLTTQMFESLLAVPGLAMLAPGDSGAVRSITSWVATDLLRFNKPLILMSGSGDKPYDWALTCLLLAIAVVATVAWSILDRRRRHYRAPHSCFRLFLRFAVGASLVTYGVVKVIPLQMPYPHLTRLLEPYGQFSLMGVLWYQVGASPAYERLVGMMELLAGIALFIPGLTLLGALLSLVAMTQVFILNMTYDVPVKLFSFHMVLMSLVLLAPDARRLVRLLILNRPAGPSTVRPLLRSAKGRRLAVAGQLVFSAWLVGFGLFGSLQSYASGPNGPEPPLYGIWEVESMTIDGQLRPPLLTDKQRWRRLVIQNATSMSAQYMDDTFLNMGAKVETESHTIVLSKGGPTPVSGPAARAPFAGRLTYQQPSPDRLILEGTVDGQALRIELQYFDRSKFRLVQSQFHWVQDYPVNR